jgi:hypothetical protein
MTLSGILEIGNHPPPIDGWSIQTTLVRDELRRRGVPVAILNINESRRIKSTEYIDVQSGLDYIFKITRFGLSHYRFHIHCNGSSKKGFVLSFVAALIGKVTGMPAILTLHAGIPQKYFPVVRPLWLRWAFKTLFGLCRYATCDSEEIRKEIVAYGIAAERVWAIPCVSAELLDWKPKALTKETDSFLSRHHPVFFSYIRLRDEYGFHVLLDGMRRFAKAYPEAGFIWAGPSTREMPAIQTMVNKSQLPAESILLLSNMDHDSFLTIMASSFATIRAHACDGVSASVLESLALHVPVIACEDGHRPASVLTYNSHDPADLFKKLIYVTENHEEVVNRIAAGPIGHNTDRMVELLTSA